MVTRFPRGYVSMYIGPSMRGGLRSRLAKNKHKAYFFFNRMNNNGKRSNSIFGGNSVFLTTPNVFYSNQALVNVVPRRTGTPARAALTPSQTRLLRSKIVNLAGGNNRIAKILINNALQARRTELPTLSQRQQKTHRAEILRYEAWHNILGNVGQHGPIQNMTPGLNRKNNIMSHFKINQNLYNKIVTHAGSKNRNTTVRPVINRQSQLFNNGVTPAMLGARKRGIRALFQTLSRQIPGTAARANTLIKLRTKINEANTMRRVLYGN